MSFLLSRRFLRFLIVGVSNTALSALIFTTIFRLLEGFSWRAVVAQTTAYSLATLWSFYWNKKWAFQSDRDHVQEGMKFISVQLFLLFFTGATLGFLIDYMGYSALMMWIIVMLVATVLNFLLLNILVFGRRKTDER